MNLIITNQYRAYTDTQLLGYQGETNARTIKVAQPHIDEATAYRLIFDCGNDVIYEVDVTGGEYIVNSGLLINIGTVKCQWQAVKLVGDTYELVAKSNIIEFEVKPSIQGDVAPIPTYEQSKSALDEVLQAAEQAQDAEAAAETAMQKATEAAEVAEQAKTETITAAATAMQKATEAEQSAALAAESAASVDLSGYYTKVQSDGKYLKRSENIPESLLTKAYEFWDVEVRHADDGAIGFAPIKKVIEPVVNNILAEQGLLPTYKFSAEGNKYGSWLFPRTGGTSGSSWVVSTSPGTAFDFEGIKVLQSVAQNYGGNPSPATFFLPIAVDIGIVQNTGPIGICALSYDYIVVVFDRQLSTDNLSAVFMEYEDGVAYRRFSPDPSGVVVFDTTSLPNRKPNSASQLLFVLTPPSNTSTNDGRHFSWSNLLYIKDIIFTNNPDEIADL